VGCRLWRSRVAADGSLLALMSFGGSLWNVDLGSGTASMVAPNRTFFNACGSTMQYRRKAIDGVGEFTNFIPAAGSDYAVAGAGTAINLAASGLKIANERGRNP